MSRLAVGFTGTREGMTERQLSAFRVWLGGLVDGRRVSAFHHGCCVGADAAAVWSVHGWPGVTIVAHPPDNPALVDQDALGRSDAACEARPYLVRNREIVDACDVLAVCPKGPEERRSGTWATARYARRCGKPLAVFWPNGTVTTEGGEF